jgi:hypothetical protein
MEWDVERRDEIGWDGMGWVGLVSALTMMKKRTVQKTRTTLFNALRLHLEARSLEFSASENIILLTYLGPSLMVRTQEN